MRAITSKGARSGTRNTGRNRWSSAGARYEVLERAGEGTVFVVYRVRDKTNNRVLALKALKGGFNKHPRFAGALTVCAQRAAKWVHPNMARVDDVGEEDGTLFLVTEWLPGQSLEARLARAPFGRAEALSATRQIAEALNYLHQNGALHGDVRPRQTGAAADGAYKLTDGGFYEAFSASGLAPTDVMSDAAWYQAPERSDGAPPSPGSDLYSLGVVLYRMLAGRVPFDGPSPLSIAMRHRKDTPMPPSQFNPQCPPDLQAVALRLLEKDPLTRYTSAGQLLRDLAVGTARPASVTTPVPVTGAVSAAASSVSPSSADPNTAPASVPATTGNGASPSPHMSTHAAAISPASSAATASPLAATAAASTVAASIAAAPAVVGAVAAGTLAAGAATVGAATVGATVVGAASSVAATKTAASAVAAPVLTSTTSTGTALSASTPAVGATPLSSYSMPAGTQPLPVAGAPSHIATPNAVAANASAANVIAPVAVAPVAVAPVGITGGAGATSASDDGDDDSVSADDAKRQAAQQAQDAEKVARKKQRRREALGAFLAVFWLLVALGILGSIFFGAYHFWQKETPREVPVPAYVGRNEATARAMLQKYGLKMVVVSQIYDTRKAAGTVVSGEPRPGKKVRVGREVGVTVSRGAEQVNMPDLSELGLQRAREIIERSGMRLGEVADQYHDTVPRGYVCGQYPQPGQPFKRSDAINLLVSRGPQPSLNNNPTQLPPPPPREDAASFEAPIGLTPREAPSGALVSRTVHVRVAIAADGAAQEVRVVVRDGDGEHTVYQKTHAPGDLVDEDVLVTRPQGTTAVVTIYVDGEERGQQRV